MSIVPRRHSSCYGIKNKPSYKAFNICVITITIILAIFVFLYCAKDWKYLGLYEVKYYINPNTGKEEGIITTISGYLLIYLWGLIAYAAFWFFQLIAVMSIMGDVDKEHDDSLYLFSKIDKIIVLVSSTLIMVLDMFQIYKII